MVVTVINMSGMVHFYKFLCLIFWGPELDFQRSGENPTIYYFFSYLVRGKYFVVRVSFLAITRHDFV